MSADHSDRVLNFSNTNREPFVKFNACQNYPLYRTMCTRRAQKLYITSCSMMFTLQRWWYQLQSMMGRYCTHHSHGAKVKVTSFELLPQAHVKCDLSVVIVIAQFNIFTNRVLDNKHPVRVQPSKPHLLRVQQLGNWHEVILPQDVHETIVKTQLTQENLYREYRGEERVMYMYVIMHIQYCIARNIGGN